MTALYGESYQGVGLLGDNCCTFMMRHFGDCVHCPLGMPNLCQAKQPF